jgi:putative ABC transport system permease protein
VTYLKELFGQVVSSLLRNKLRSVLTMAGIAWGVASMVLIVAMGDGFKVGQRDRPRQLGENVVIVFPGRTEKQADAARGGASGWTTTTCATSARNASWCATRSPNFRIR